MTYYSQASPFLWSYPWTNNQWISALGDNPVIWVPGEWFAWLMTTIVGYSAMVVHHWRNHFSVPYQSDPTAVVVDVRGKIVLSPSNTSNTQHNDHQNNHSILVSRNNHHNEHEYVFCPLSSLRLLCILLPTIVAINSWWSQIYIYITYISGSSLMLLIARSQTLFAYQHWWRTSMIPWIVSVCFSAKTLYRQEILSNNAKQVCTTVLPTSVGSFSLPKPMCQPFWSNQGWLGGGPMGRFHYLFWAEKESGTFPATKSILLRGWLVYSTCTWIFVWYLHNP